MLTRSRPSSRSSYVMHDVIIIGAGPAGLALGYWLKASGQPCLLLEAGKIGESWRRMPEGTCLLSPWWTNVLPGTRIKLTGAWRKVSSEDYARYLEDYAQATQLTVHQQTKVLGIKRIPNTSGFEIETDHTAHTAKLVVCTTGYYQNPHIPALSGGNDGSIGVLHASAYVDPQQLLKVSGGGRRILIVGKRITAGQMMQDLHDQGFTVHLSARSPIQTRARWRMNVWKERLYFLYESVFVRFFPTVKATSRPIMDGGDKADLLKRGLIRRVGEVHAVRGGRAHFVDGTMGAYDAVIFATGYRPALGYLETLIAVDKQSGMPDIARMESREVPGIFFLGLENLRNFLSPYLRGIRSDARVLARVLCRRLKDNV